MRSSIKVGAFALAAMLVAAWFILRIQHIRLGRNPGIQYQIAMNDADGLQEKAWVLFKGVRVGKVSEIDLGGDGVRATVRMERRIPLRDGASARVLSVGLLGEKQLELIQGPEGTPLLPDGAILVGVPSASFDRVLQMASEVGDDVKDVSTTVKEAVEGEDEAHNLRAVLANLSELVVELRDFIRANREGVQQSVDGARVTAENFKALSESLVRTANTLEALAAKVEHGDGAVGKLVSDPATGEKLDEALGAVTEGAHAVTDAVDGASGLRFGIGVRADYLAARGGLRGELSVNLAPASDWSLALEAVTQPGRTMTSRALGVTSPVELPAGDGDDPLLWSALLGYRLSAFQVRMGFIESRPGLMGELYLFDDKLRLGAEVWDFSRAEEVPHARLEAQVYPARPFFLVGGWDDPLPGGVSSAFLGAGLKFGP